MALGHALQDVAEIGEGLDVVEFCGGDEGANGGPSLRPAIGAGEQMILAAQRRASAAIGEPVASCTSKNLRRACAQQAASTISPCTVSRSNPA